MTRLDELPEELISNISLRLHADDVASFRLTSRALERKSFHEFATEYFHEKCFMFTTESLAVLVGIANSERLREYLHQIHVMTAIFSDRAFACPAGCGCGWQPSMKQKEAYRWYVEDQKTLTKTGRDSEMLFEAFKNLPNLVALHVDDSPNVLGPDVDYRGGNKIPRLTNRHPMMAPTTGSKRDTDVKEYNRFFRHVWQVVMQASRGSQSLTKLATLLSKSNHALTPEQLDTKDFKSSISTLNRLQTLILRIRTSPAARVPGSDKKASAARDVKILTRFASALKDLRNVDIAFDKTIVSGPYFTAIASGLDLKLITYLRLDTVMIEVSHLAMAITKLQNVQDLRFMFVDLSEGTWIAILKLLQGMVDHLKHLHLMYCLEEGTKVYFLKQREDPHADGGWDDFDGDSYHSGADDLSESSDAELPPLVGEDTVNGMDGQHPASNTTPLGDTESTPNHTHDAENHSNVNHVRPDDPDTGERGYFVCVQGDQIAAQLPTFIAEHNLGGSIDDELGIPIPAFPPGTAPNLNNLVSMLTAYIPPPGFTPAPAAGNGGGTAGNTGGNAANTGGANATDAAAGPMFGFAPGFMLSSAGTNGAATAGAGGHASAPGPAGASASTAPSPMFDDNESDGWDGDDDDMD